MDNIQVFTELEWTVAVKWATHRFKQKLTDSILALYKDNIRNKQSVSSDKSGPISQATALQRASSPQLQTNNSLTDYTLDDTTKVHHLQPSSPTSVVLLGHVHRHRKIKVQALPEQFPSN